MLVLSGVGTYLRGTARTVPLLKVGQFLMHFAVPLFGHRMYIAQIILYLLLNNFSVKFFHINVTYEY